MKISIINKQRKIFLDTKFLKKAALYIGNKFDKSDNVQVNIIFTSIKKIKELNKNYRNIDQPTDVLSFSYLNNYLNNNSKAKLGYNAKQINEEIIEIGEIIICPEIAKLNINTGNAATGNSANSIEINKEIIFLIIHGFLHLFGYDHEKKKEKIDFDNIQKNLFSDVLNHLMIF